MNWQQSPLGRMENWHSKSCGFGASRLNRLESRMLRPPTSQVQGCIVWESQIGISSKLSTAKIDELKTQSDKISWYLILSRSQIGKPHQRNRNRNASVSLSKLLDGLMTPLNRAWLPVLNSASYIIAPLLHCSCRPTVSLQTRDSWGCCNNPWW